MNYSKQYLVELATKTNFIKDNLEKVLRLAEILKFLNTDTIFKGKLALKGGTAINLTAIELPRLSVDIDLDFTENLSKDEIAQIKEKFTNRLTDYMWQEGYFMQSHREHYALLSFVFNYLNNAGNRDSIKVEINFMDRCHILPLETKSIMAKGIIEPFEILTLNRIELYASKINALLSRATPRDLYDVNMMIEQNIIIDKTLLKKCLIFYNMIGGEQDIDNINFDNINKIDFMKFKTQLRPVIAKNDKFDLEQAKTRVIDYLSELIKLDEMENLFVQNFRCNIYMPNLLFDKHEQTKNIILHPMAIWKCKDKVKTTNITLNKVKHNCGFIDFLNALLDMIIDKKNADYRLKIISKIGIDIESNRAKEEIKHYETNNIIKAICSINELKKKIYYSSLSQDYKKDSLYQLDIFIQKLEFGVLLSKSEYIYIENLERLVSD